MKSPMDYLVWTIAFILAAIISFVFAWLSLPKEQAFPCPRCSKNLRKQKKSYQGNGLKAENSIYKCQGCGTESTWQLHYSGKDGTRHVLWSYINFKGEKVYPHMRGKIDLE